MPGLDPAWLENKVCAVIDSFGNSPNRFVDRPCIWASTTPERMEEIRAAIEAAVTAEKARLDNLRQIADGAMVRPDPGVYQFVATVHNPLDIPRICRETLADGRSVAIVDGGDNRLILIHKSFCPGVVRGDGLLLCTTPFPAGMWTRAGFEIQPDGVSFDYGTERDEDRLPDGWSARMASETVPVIVAQIETIRAYVRRRTITVTLP